MELRISLRAARVNAGITAEEAAKTAGVSKGTIMSWERGRTTPRVDRLRALCEAYRIPIDNIFLPSGFAKSERAVGKGKWLRLST